MPRPKLPRVVPTLLLVAALPACAPEPGEGTAPAPEAGGPAELDRLRSLPYASSVAGSVDDTEDGVVFHDPDRAWQGVSLYASRPLCLAELIDMQGRVLRSWSEPGCLFWENAELLSDGGLLVVGADAQRDDARFLARFDASGARVWRRALPLHHDMEEDPLGGILALQLAYVARPGIHPELPVRDDAVVRLSDEGRPLDSVSILEALVGARGLEGLAAVAPKRKWGKHFVDLIHANSVERMKRPALFGTHPLYDERHALVCSRHQNLVAILDLESGEAPWVWGQDTLDGPHDAQLLASGRVLIFDNGLARGWSRVLEVDPRTDEIVWEYPGEGDPPFYTASRGAAQRLPNGNTLITNSNSGEVFEITPEGLYAWHFFNPNRNARGERTTLFRMKRYPLSAAGGGLP